jgi:hypothetical protein
MKTSASKTLRAFGYAYAPIVIFAVYRYIGLSVIEAIGFTLLCATVSIAIIHDSFRVGEQR